MGETDMDLLRSPNAIVGRRQINGECGGATVFCLILADGEIIDCGSDGYAHRRALTIAAAINAFGPDKLSRAALAAMKERAS